MTDAVRPLPRLTFGPDGPRPGTRVLAEEVAVALSFNGTTQAVMMATPADLQDFAVGFAATEGLARPADILSLDIVPAGAGIDVQVWLTDTAAGRLAARRRHMAGPVGCGLCGIDSIDAALAVPDPVAPSPLRLTPAAIAAAHTALRCAQPLHDATRAVHAAGFWTEDRMAGVREDVGRHNALDKLAGWVLRAGVDPATGAVVMTSRVSIDLVQKVARLGAPMLIAASAPTAAAVDLADRLGITLVTSVRDGQFDLWAHSDRIAAGVPHAG
ncbi:MAG: formate dehydrogenase accessory sulfurtransferase FdhD [Rhodobacteraceae bacterium]|jgi:FdhD protein|nr:formate dehydrogenase accessory sulfurtransferase FdhD [Paracoccaceae bacterium]